MRSNYLAVMAGFVACLAFGGAARAGEQQVGSWKIITDPTGRFASMAYADPNVVALASLESLEIVMGTGAVPTQGHLKFKTGFKRDMTPEEVTLYFAQLEGGKAAWDYLASMNQVTKYPGGTTALPATLSGKKVRLILVNGNNYFGTITVDATKPGGVFLAVDGACGGPIRFENSVIREAQAAAN
jgi:hypothetical protein